MCSAYTVLVGKHEGKTQFARHKRRLGIMSVCVLQKWDVKL
jgi:hypothetical protein